MYSLVVVDMQAKFHAALDKKVQEHCKKAIRRAIKSRAAIIFVEYVDHGPTLPCLTNLTKNYHRVFHTSKDDWDGSRHTLKVAENHSLPLFKIKVCGVYTDCCVHATVRGLSQKKPFSKIEILKEACGATNATAQDTGIKRMLELKNVRAWNRN